MFGLLNVQAGEIRPRRASLDAHFGEPTRPRGPGPSLWWARPNGPSRPRRALIRLVYIEAWTRAPRPAVVCCGGRMEFQGAPMSRTWLKLGRPPGPAIER